MHIFHKIYISKTQTQEFIPYQNSSKMNFAKSTGDDYTILRINCENKKSQKDINDDVYKTSVNSSFTYIFLFLGNYSYLVITLNVILTFST